MRKRSWSMPANAHLRIMAPQISISSPDDPFASMCKLNVYCLYCVRCYAWPLVNEVVIIAQSGSWLQCV